MNIAIAKKHALFRMKLELVGIKETKIWPTCTTKGVKDMIIWFLLKKALEWRRELENFGWKPIDEISGG
jgi:hypothetical protein